MAKRDQEIEPLSEETGDVLDGAIINYIEADGPYGPGVFVFDFIVDGPLRGRGVGKAQFLSWSTRLPPGTPVYLSVTPSSVGFWKHLGFRRLYPKGTGVDADYYFTQTPLSEKNPGAKAKQTLKNTKYYYAKELVGSPLSFLVMNVRNGNATVTFAEYFCGDLPYSVSKNTFLLSYILDPDASYREVVSDDSAWDIDKKSFFALSKAEQKETLHDLLWAAATYHDPEAEKDQKEFFPRPKGT